MGEKIQMLVQEFLHKFVCCARPDVLYVCTYLSRGQGGEAVGVEELNQGADWDLGAYPEQHGEGCINQIQAGGLQAGGAAAQRLLWVGRAGVVHRQRLQATKEWLLTQK